MKKSILLCLFFMSFLSNLHSQTSVAHQWTEEILFCIRNSFARPPIHARNLFHLSVVMHDAFSAYKVGSKTVLLDNEWHGFYTPFYGVEIPSTPGGIEEAQEEAISYGAYRFLRWRFQNAPGVAAIYIALDARMALLGYDISITSVDYVNDGPAALGNYIAQQIIAFGLQDGSNEAANFASQYYTDGNPFLFPAQPGNPNMVDPNRFQRLSIENAIDQAGNPINGTPPHLAPEWGNVLPFALKDEDSEIIVRDGDEYKVYHNPGAPVYLDTNIQTGIEDFFKWNFLLVSVWQSHLDTTDNVMWDISPASGGNIPFENLPDTWSDYLTFYDFFNGGDPGVGYNVNPITGLPYEPQIVRRGDYARVLAEFWADGLDSETPPGHWFNIYNEISQHPLYVNQWKGEGPILSDLEYDIDAYFLLGGAMHDAAIGAWGVKGAYDYVRPISAIRYMGDRGQSSDPLLPNYHPAGMPLIPGYVELVMPGDTLVGDNNEHLHKIKLYTWRGHDYIEDEDIDMAGVGWILAENWWPYQRPSFVTPPFAGYVSGHSTYSRAAAAVMDYMTGTPYFPGGMSNFEAEQNEFLEFEQGPSQTITLQWATYYDASDQCSLSRIWGGIHPPMDDIAGRKIGQRIGDDAGDFADSLLTMEIPFVVNVDINTGLINVSQIGSQMQINITYNSNMNTSVNPVVLFPGFVNANSLFTVQSQSWLSATEFQIIYNVEDFEIEQGSVAISMYNAESASNIKQNPFLLLNELYVDTKAPILSSYEASTSVLNSQSTAVCVTMTFDEPCEVSFIPFIEWTGAAGIEAALTLDAANSSWTTSNVYNACFNFDGQLPLDPGFLTFEVTNVYDMADNVIDETLVQDVLFLDVDQPSISLVANQPLLNISNIGNNAITLTITSNKPMSTDNLPIINITENSVSVAELTVNTLLSSWVDDFTCNMVYNLGSNPIAYANLDIEIQSIMDVSGNLPLLNSFEDVFILDTERPESELLISNYEMINDATVAGADFHIEVTFSEDMNQVSFTPLVAIKDENGISIAGVSYNVFQSLWIAPNIFRARFNVTDLNYEMENLQVEVSLARDISNNPMLLSAASASFALDTRNPEMIAFDISETVLNQNSTTVVITSTFDEMMIAANVPNFVAVTSEGDLPMFTPILEEGEWLDEYTYSGKYLINHIYFAGNAGMRVITATDLASNPVKDTVVEDILTIDFLYLGLNQQVANSIVAYPNPVTSGGVLNFRTNESNEVINEIELYDLLGNLVNTITTDEGNPELVSIKVPELSSGTYIIRIKSDFAEYTLRINIIN